MLLIISCKNEVKSKKNESTDAHIIRPKYAKGFYFQEFNNFKILTVTQPWLGADQSISYILANQNVEIPNAYLKYPVIHIPVKRIVVTSTTHIPSLEMLGKEKTLVGFPETNFISSEKTRALIDAGKIVDLGANESINSELMLSLRPEILVGFSVNQRNKAYDNFEKAGIQVIYNGDWTEPAPLGKAEWIKFFGALYGLENKADSIFDRIEKNYLETVQLAKQTTDRPTVISGTLFKDVWYLPAGESWAAQFLSDAGANYLWKETKGTGSLSLSIENVLEKASRAEFWIGADSFATFDELKNANVHYQKIKAFQDQNVYSYSTTKGRTGGNLYFELAPNRPDLVLKDLIHILHPELLPNHENVFFKKLH
ncbi:MAG: ABC transporter substrate-binding protein [Flavobacteriaceae bacterium]|nr:ABC transporter substrate-binding protein [Flavobacteriaceae bacterium]